MYALNKNDFEVIAACSKKEAMQYLNDGEKFDLLLLDVTLPDGTGFEVCDLVRKSGNNVPIIFLTAMDEETNIMRGLDSGGDDYITKPFKLGELCSRIKALLRRSGQTSEQNTGVLQSGDVMIDLLESRVMLSRNCLKFNKCRIPSSLCVSKKL